MHDRNTFSEALRRATRQLGIADEARGIIPGRLAATLLVAGAALMMPGSGSTSMNTGGLLWLAGAITAITVAMRPLRARLPGIGRSRTD